MNVDSVILGLVVLAAVAAHLRHRRKPRRVLNELCEESTLFTSLRMSRVRAIVAQALRHPLGAVITEKPNRYECRFKHEVNGEVHEVVLHIDLGVVSAHRAHGVGGRVGVARMDFPGSTIDPAVRLAFRDATRLRRRVVDALAKADITSTRSTEDIKWVYRTHCVRAEG